MRFETWLWKKILKILKTKWSDEVCDGDVFREIGETKDFARTIRKRKAS